MAEIGIFVDYVWQLTAGGGRSGSDPRQTGPQHRV